MEKKYTMEMRTYSRGFNLPPNVHTPTLSQWLPSSQPV